MRWLSVYGDRRSLVGRSVFVRDPLGADDDPYGAEVSEVDLPSAKSAAVTPEAASSTRS